MKFVIKREHKVNCCPNFALAIPQTIYCFMAKLTEDLVSCAKNFRHVWRIRQCSAEFQDEKDLITLLCSVLSICGIDHYPSPCLGFGLAKCYFFWMSKAKTAWVRWAGKNVTRWQWPHLCFKANYTNCLWVDTAQSFLHCDIHTPSYPPEGSLSNVFCCVYIGKFLLWMNSGI